MKPFIALAILTTLGVSSTAIAVERPNIIFILADDLGWSDTTLYGTTRFYKTPNIERLAKRGMTFTRAYSASPLCSPTRSAILTGLSPARTGLTTPNCHLPQVVLEATVGKNGPPTKHAIAPQPVTRLKTEYPNLAKSLQASGYATGHFGKWHLGPQPYSPLQQGFDVDIPHHAGPGPAGSYVAPWKFKDFDHDPDVPDQHIEDRMAIEATAFIEKHQHEPFYLNYWMFSVHAPFDAKKSLIDQYLGTINRDDPQQCPTYAAMVQSMDDAVGTLLDTLDRLQLMDNTIIVFTSDNGGNMYNEVEGVPPTSNVPLRGGKASMFEGGTRVPCIVAWPGKTIGGSRSDALVQSEDFYPTLLAGLGLSPAKEQLFDGASILPALAGDSLDHKAIFQYFPHDPPVPDWIPPSVSVHRDSWKLIRVFHAGESGAHRYHLFNLETDISEQHDVADQKPELVRELDGLISDFLAKTNAMVPIVNASFDPMAYNPSLEGKRPQVKQTKQRKKAAATLATVGGWQVSNVTQLEELEGHLRITAGGNDPWISTRQVPVNSEGPFTVTMTLSSTSAGPSTVYYSDKEAPGFNRQQSVDFAVTHDGERRDYEVTLPTGRVTALRVDPGSAAGVVVLERLILRDAIGHETTLVPRKP